MIARRLFSSSAAALGKAKLPAAQSIGFNLTAEQKEYQDLARKFTKDHIIPNVCRIVFCVYQICQSTTTFRLLIMIKPVNTHQKS
jgi:hypothetical protein